MQTIKDCNQDRENKASDLLHRKKERETKAPMTKKAQNRGNKKLTEKEEERILRHALKMSELEYKEKCGHDLTGKSNKPKFTFKDIEPCTTITATDDDFKNPIAFFNSIWGKDKSTGIIKIIPPKNWKEMNFRLFKQEYCKRFYNSDKKLDTRKIVLNELYTAKVSQVLSPSILILLLIDIA